MVRKGGFEPPRCCHRQPVRSPDLRQLPRSRAHILSERVGLTRCRLDLEVAVVRRAPLVDNLVDLDELILEGEPTRCLLTPSARVAVDGNGESVAHAPSVRARETKSPCGSRAIAVVAPTRYRHVFLRFSGTGLLMGSNPGRATLKIEELDEWLARRAVGRSTQRSTFLHLMWVPQSRASASPFSLAPVPTRGWRKNKPVSGLARARHCQVEGASGRVGE